MIVKGERKGGCVLTDGVMGRDTETGFGGCNLGWDAR